MRGIIFVACIAILLFGAQCQTSADLSARLKKSSPITGEGLDDYLIGLRSFARPLASGTLTLEKLQQMESIEYEMFMLTGQAVEVTSAADSLASQESSKGTAQDRDENNNNQSNAVAGRKLRWRLLNSGVKIGYRSSVSRRGRSRRQANRHRRRTRKLRNRRHRKQILLFTQKSDRRSSPYKIYRKVEGKRRNLTRRSRGGKRVSRRRSRLRKVAKSRRQARRKDLRLRRRYIRRGNYRTQRRARIISNRARSSKRLRLQNRNKQIAKKTHPSRRKTRRSSRKVVRSTTQPRSSKKLKILLLKKIKRLQKLNIMKRRNHNKIVKRNRLSKTGKKPINRRRIKPSINRAIRRKESPLQRKKRRAITWKILKA